MVESLSPPRGSQKPSQSQGQPEQQQQTTAAAAAAAFVPPAVAGWAAPIHPLTEDFLLSHSRDLARKSGGQRLAFC